MSESNTNPSVAGGLSKEQTAEYWKRGYVVAPALVGQDVATVSATLGHSSPAVTMAVYAHALTSKKAEAAARMDALFGSTGS